MKRYSVAFLAAYVYCAAVSSFAPSQNHPFRTAVKQSSSRYDYLTSLSKPFIPESSDPNEDRHAYPQSPANGVSQQQQILTPPPINGDYDHTPPKAASPQTFAHAPLSYFSLDLLTPKGPRKGADVGQPHDATRPMDIDSRLAAGSWWCSMGGWPSDTPRTTTEVFWVISGHGCVTDQDGTRHYFGPGDTVILPMLWTGRWDVLEPIHKVWCVHDHVPLPEFALHAVVRPYHELAENNDGESCNILYQTKSTRVGCTTYPAGSAYEHSNAGATEWWHILEGVLYLTNAEDGSAQRCVPGDTLVVPAGEFLPLCSVSHRKLTS